MYEFFKALLETAEKIGKVEKAELSKYGKGWIDITGTTESGNSYNLCLRLEDTKDGD